MAVMLANWLGRHLRLSARTPTCGLHVVSGWRPQRGHCLRGVQGSNYKAETVLPCMTQLRKAGMTLCLMLWVVSKSQAGPDQEEKNQSHLPLEECKLREECAGWEEFWWPPLETPQSNQRRNGKCLPFICSTGGTRSRSVQAGGAVPRNSHREGGEFLLHLTKKHPRGGQGPRALAWEHGLLAPYTVLDSWT